MNRPTRNRRHRPPCAFRRAGFTLVELLLLLTIMGIVASIAVPTMQSSGIETVESTARIIAADLRLAHSLAVQYNTDWTVRFDSSNNAYALVHTGSGNPPVPKNPRARPGDPSDEYVVYLDRLSAGTKASLSVDRVEFGQSPTVTDRVTFGPLGGTGPQPGSSADRSEDTVVWVTASDGQSRLSVPLSISWVTGQAQIGEPVTP